MKSKVTRLFTTTGYNKTGTQVGMGMENYYSVAKKAYVSGTVDFH